MELIFKRQFQASKYLTSYQGCNKHQNCNSKIRKNVKPVIASLLTCCHNVRARTRACNFTCKIHSVVQKNQYLIIKNENCSEWTLNSKEQDTLNKLLEKSLKELMQPYYEVLKVFLSFAIGLFFILFLANRYFKEKK